MMIRIIIVDTPTVSSISVGEAGFSKDYSIHHSPHNIVLPPLSNKAPLTLESCIICLSSRLSDQDKVNVSQI
jgi:hypothetical protein